VKADDIFDVMGGIVLVALCTTLVTSPNTAKIVTSLGNAFGGSIKAALGN
jgi:hypothetical protein